MRLQIRLGTYHESRQAGATGPTGGSHAQVQYVDTRSHCRTRQRQKHRTFPAHPSGVGALGCGGYWFRVQPDSPTAIKIGQVQHPVAGLACKVHLKLDPVPDHIANLTIRHRNAHPTRALTLRRQRVDARVSASHVTAPEGGPPAQPIRPGRHRPAPARPPGHGMRQRRPICPASYTASPREWTASLL